MRFARPRRAACSERATEGIAARLEEARRRDDSPVSARSAASSPRDRGELDFFLAHTPAESMVQTPDGRHEITDVNLRFGGAFTLPLAAGGAFPEFALARGERLEPRLGQIQDGVVMTRCFSHLCLTAGEDGTLVPLPEDASPVLREPSRSSQR